MNHVCFDGRIVPGDQPVLNADNRGYRYGDGLFETMKMIRGTICLEALHFERFFTGLQTLGIELSALLNREKLVQQITQLCERNGCAQLARIRLSASRGDGSLYDDSDQFHYLIECWPVSESVNQLNDNGLIIDIYPEARKSCDAFSNLKSANYLPYVMAARYAKANKLNECLVLNAHGQVADATIANVFLIRKGLVLTPPLTAGCVNGVMRKYLMEKLSPAASDYHVMEANIGALGLLQADEVFFTNAMNGIRWVKQFRNKEYTNKSTVDIYNRFVKTIWE